uniref:ScMYB73 protein n=1 Tax=Saccharum hybrid cultivar Co 86032 TaxID=672234 RepID=A0A0C6WCN6_9POAL|nr:ScMYB73 protein [Saccharum hybrid cultivar Co 86032]
MTSRRRCLWHNNWTASWWPPCLSCWNSRYTTCFCSTSSGLWHACPGSRSRSTWCSSKHCSDALSNATPIISWVRDTFQMLRGIYTNPYLPMSAFSGCAAMSQYAIQYTLVHYKLFYMLHCT